MHTLQELAVTLFEAKQLESKAKKTRIEAEEQIAKLIETPEQGSKTEDAGNGIRITVKRGLLFKADVDAIREMDIPEEVMPIKCIPASYAFDMKTYEYVRGHHPDVASKLARHITTKPAKTAVTLKLG